jgi:hypothetical protein
MAFIRLTLFLFIGFCISASGASGLPRSALLKDTSIINKNLYKLNEGQFMDRYGTDDSSRALIHFFFSKRTKSFQYILIPLAIDAIAGILIGIFGPLVMAGAGYIGYLLILIITGLVGVTITLSILGGATLIKYSRKKLFRLLTIYHAGGSIRKHISGTAYFKKLLLVYK